ncbi:DUF6973 domain-containing protein [Nocardia asteroides]|uniref:DUF6973 domain-containing protein n=1 Tax=Nocardia asteroides TaxID=1824 RepID=UPI00343FBBA1
MKYHVREVALILCLGLAPVLGLAAGPASADPGSESDIPPGNHQWAVYAANAQYCVPAGPEQTARDDAYSQSRRLFRYAQGCTGGDDEQDAAHHCIWQALMVKRASAQFAIEFGNAHEADGGDQGSPSSSMDQANNVIGRRAGEETAKQSDDATYSQYAELVKNRTLTVIRGPFGSIRHATDIPSEDGSIMFNAFAYESFAKCATEQRAMIDSQTYRSAGGYGKVSVDSAAGPSIFVPRGAPVGGYMIATVR